MNITVKPKESINGLFSVPGDKSISHRAVMLGALAKGTTRVSGFLDGADCRSTINCFRQLGVDIHHEGENVEIHGLGMRGLQKPKGILDAGNSGTTIRLISGILAAQSFDSQITGDESIQKRPMNRVIGPLGEMGAKIKGQGEKNLAPLSICGGSLKGISYPMPMASAQVKSALILAGLYAEGCTEITEPAPARDHTEIMLNYLGADIRKKGSLITVHPAGELYGREIIVPGDISSAAYFIVAALILPGSKVIVTNVGVNFTRTGIIAALREMGGNVEILNRRSLCGEWVADLEIRSSHLTGSVLEGQIIPRMIDEIPVFAVAALFAQGKTVIRNAEELKVKESNRIAAMVEELSKMGAVIEETHDGMIIHGGHPLHGAAVDSHDDHRIAMSLGIAALAAQGDTEISGASYVNISFPGFFEMLERC